jgi:hypothetical protein
MTLWQKAMRLLLHYRETMSKMEVDGIGELQQTAKRRRAEFAAEQEQAALTKTDHSQKSLATSRKRVMEAEAAYASAIQAWDDKQFRR